MIGLAQVYLLAGMTFAVFALLSARDASNPKRFANAAFWGAAGVLHAARATD